MTTRTAVLATRTPCEFSRAVAAAPRVAKTQGFTRCYPLLTDELESRRLLPIVDHYGLQWLPFDQVVVTEEPGAGADRRNGSSRHLLLLGHDTMHATAATVYARATGKRVIVVEDWSAILESLAPGSADSILLVDNRATFHKTFLAWLLQHPVVKAASAGAGILTAYSQAAFSSLILRMLLLRDCQPTASETSPKLYRVVAEHGNEMHMYLENDEVLCGATNFAGSPRPEAAFDCVPTCPHANRIPAASIAVHHLLISSCNTFTLGDGLVPAEFSLLFSLLSGWCCSVLAPFKHALTGPGVPILIEALARSGLSLGAIAERLNSIAVFGEQADPAYVLLGDPELVVAAPSTNARESIAQNVGDGVSLEASLDNRCALEIPLPGDLTENALRLSRKLAVVPMCEALRSPDVYFSFRQISAHGGWNLLLFSGREFPQTRAHWFMTGASGLAEHQHIRALEGVRALHQLAAFGVRDPVIRSAEDDILTQVRFAASYPRLIEFAIGELVIRNLDTILDEKFAAARHVALQDLLELTADRLWLSQNYARFYTSVRRERGATDTCSYCRCETTKWLYEDECAGHPARTLVICARCGIVADHPAAKELSVRMATVDELPLEGLRLPIVIENLSDRPVRFSIAAQFHEWRNMGVTCDLRPQSASIAPGESVEQEVAFTFAKPMADSMQDIHVFTLTEDFELSCFTQKMVSRHGAFTKQQLVPAEILSRPR